MYCIWCIIITLHVGLAYINRPTFSRGIADSVRGKVNIVTALPRPLCPEHSTMIGSTVIKSTYMKITQNMCDVKTESIYYLPKQTPCVQNDRCDYNANETLTRTKVSTITL